MVFLVFFVSIAFIPSSFALGDYDLISEWGQFGIAKPGHFSYPEFIAVDEQGNSYVSDLGNKWIQKFSSDGQYITHWGQSGTLPGEFHYPSGIAVSSNFVYVADHDLHKIQKFYLNGTFTDQWGSKGIHDGEFKYPNGIAVDSENFVYVVDTGNQRIQKFTSDGEFVLSFGTSGMSPGQFLTVIGIDIDDEGYVYVTDRGNRKIEKFDSDGSFIKSFPFRGLNYIFSPAGIKIDPNGTIYVVNSDNGRILHLEQDIGLTLNIFEKNGPYPRMFSSPTDIALGINGELLVVDSAGHKIYSLETPFYVEPEINEITKIIVPEISQDYTTDKIEPTIMAPSNMILDATGLFTFVDIGEAIAADNESGIKVILNNAPEEFSLGVNKVTWTAFDYAGNTAETYQTITINACGHVYSDYHKIVGTADDDFIQGTSADDLIFGLDGADIISGHDGNDCIFGGNDDDIIYGNNGYDTIMGDSGNDVLKGDSGFDIIYSNSGSDVMDGGDDSDECYSPINSKTDLLINCE
ncbi:MAG: 6-bladed beta-propeller [Nitrosopumilus sp.]|nr:6-bladed beta-propeller [Nitrosopumilus sp.]MDH3486881.1 6-bladed beta-propeller [Nitrosopumilus sp.]